MTNALQRLVAFINHEATAGLILVAAAVAALVASNMDGLQNLYALFLATPVSVAIGPLSLSKPLLLWINDGLMAVFFFLVGLEIKREVLEGSLSSRDQIALPAVAALGGMVAPALVYSLITYGDAVLMRGWAIPAATDIAFALGALSLAGNRVPLSLKVFLLTLATLDDLGAIIVIALFYTAKLSVLALVLAGGAIALLIILNLAGASRLSLYVIIGIAMWVFVLKSGIHATLAGVALALTIPLKHRDGGDLIHPIEEGLHPYIKFLILPLFAFANAGVSLQGLTPASLFESLPLGIAVALVVGKPLGIVAATSAAVATGLARLPDGTGWQHIAGIGCLAGIGFTMSLFIGMLAFDDAAQTVGVRIGVLAGSAISVVVGLALLLTAVPKQQDIPTR